LQSESLFLTLVTFTRAIENFRKYQKIKQTAV